MRKSCTCIFSSANGMQKKSKFFKRVKEGGEWFEATKEFTLIVPKSIAIWAILDPHWLPREREKKEGFETINVKKADFFSLPNGYCLDLKEGDPKGKCQVFLENSRKSKNFHTKNQKSLFLQKKYR